MRSYESMDIKSIILRDNIYFGKLGYDIENKYAGYVTSFCGTPSTTSQLDSFPLSIFFVCLHIHLHVHEAVSLWRTLCMYF